MEAVGHRYRIIQHLRPVITVAATFVAVVPTSHVMPRLGLDPSWQLGLNQAVAQHLQFGRDVIFTYGPASSVMTNAYHPATFRHVVVLGTILAICASWSLRTALLPTSQIAISLLLLGSPSREVTLALLPLLGLTAVLNDFSRTHVGDTRWSRLATTCAATIPLGILPTIKGTLFPIVGLAYVIAISFLALRRHKVYASLACILPFAAFAGTWLHFGQHLGNVVAYFAGVIEEARGYADAMHLGSFKGSWLIALILMQSVVLVALMRNHSKYVHNAGVDFLLFATELVLIKEGLTRPLGHVYIAVSAILMLTALACTQLKPRPRIYAAASALLSTLLLVSQFGTSQVRDGFPMRQFTNIIQFIGLSNNLTVDPGHLPATYNRALKAIARRDPLPLLTGSADIYSWDQASLIASGSPWNPRPIIQSYSAYTPALASANAQHLSGTTAPHWLIMRPQTLDKRLPTSDDGPSLLSMLANYHLYSSGPNEVILQRGATEGHSTLTTSQESSLHEVVKLPQGHRGVFVRLSPENSWPGKIASAVLKPDRLRISLNYTDGTLATYTLVPEMATAGVLISPTITTVDQLAVFFSTDSGEIGKNKSRQVASFTVTTSRGWMWKPAFRVTLLTID